MCRSSVCCRIESRVTGFCRKEWMEFNAGLSVDSIHSAGQVVTLWNLNLTSWTRGGLVITRCLRRFLQICIISICGKLANRSAGVLSHNAALTAAKIGREPASVQHAFEASRTGSGVLTAY